MPSTLTGWLLLAALMVSTGCGSSLATKLVMFSFGRAPYHRRDIPILYLFMAGMFLAGTLYILVEPVKP